LIRHTHIWIVSCDLFVLGLLAWPTYFIEVRVCGIHLILLPLSLIERVQVIALRVHLDLELPTKRAFSGAHWIWWSLQDKKQGRGGTLT
jgi:hypothetical protein